MVAPDVEIDDGKGNFSICFYSLFSSSRLSLIKCDQYFSSANFALLSFRPKGSVYLPFPYKRARV